MRPQRLAKGVPHEGGAVDDVTRRAFELRVGQEREPRTEGRAIPVVCQACRGVRPDARRRPTVRPRRVVPE